METVSVISEMTRCVLVPADSGSLSQRFFIGVKSFLWPLTHCFQNGSNYLVIAVVIDMIFHRHFLVSKRLNVVCKFLRSGYLEIMGAKTTRLRVAETSRLQLNEIRTVVRVSALPRHFKENGSSMNGAVTLRRKELGYMRDEGTCQHHSKHHPNIRCT